MYKKKSILLTFDVEDWFQVENFKPYIDFSTWNSFEIRVRKNTDNILDLLDSFPFSVKATFFILGWVAEKFPGLVHQIHSRGHEVASHGFNHHLCTHLDTETLGRDLADSKSLLEDLTGERIFGYRAPSFAITDKVLESIVQAGYRYDSSFNSFSAHGRYGTISLGKATKKNSAYLFKDNFYEIPVTNLELFNRILPIGGGGYFRLYPLFFFNSCVQKILKKQDAFVFYAHPWEFDPDQPRVHRASKWFKFRHYVNLDKTEKKLRSMISAFFDCQFITCLDYIKKINRE